MVWPNVMVSVWAPNSRSRCHVPVGLARQRPAGDAAHVAGHHLAHVALGDQVPQVQQRRIGPSLQADDVAHARGSRQIGHLLGLLRGPAQRPFDVNVLPRVDGRHGGIVVVGHAQAHGHGVDLRVGHHGVVIVERQARAELLARLLGALHAGGADSGELKLGTGDHGGQVRTHGPSPVDVGSDDTQANLVCHDVTPASDFRAS